MLLIVLPLLLIAALIAYLRFTPYIRQAAKTRVVNAASDLIVDAVNEQLESDLDFSRMIYLEKDASGSVTAVQTNVAQMNRLKNRTLDTIGKRMLDIDAQQLSVPVGNLILPELLAGTGPRLPVKIVSFSSSDAEFTSDFEAAGINQTLQRIVMTVRVTLNVLSPAGAERVEVTSDVVVAQAVIVGGVPESYLTINK